MFIRFFYEIEGTYPIMLERYTIIIISTSSMCLALEEEKEAKWGYIVLGTRGESPLCFSPEVVKSGAV